MSEDELALFNDSLERCIRERDFLDRFYRAFLASSEEVAAKFAHTDFQRQKAILAASLFTISQFAQRRPKIQAELELIAQIHSRSARDIRPEFYDLWRECLMGTVAACDPHFNADADRAWRTVLNQGIEFMKARYSRRPPHRREGDLDCGCDPERIGSLHAFLTQHFPALRLTDAHFPELIRRASLPPPHERYHIVGMVDADATRYVVMSPQFHEHYSPADINRRLEQWRLTDAFSRSFFVVLDHQGLTPWTFAAA